MYSNLNARSRELIKQFEDEAEEYFFIIFVEEIENNGSITDELVDELLNSYDPKARRRIDG